MPRNCAISTPAPCIIRLRRLKALRRGWLLGSQEFREKMLEQIDGKIGEHHLGKLRLQTAEAKADRSVSEDLGRLNRKETDLRSRRQSDPAKLAMAARLRRETTLWIKAIGSRVHLGTSKSPNIRLHTAMRLTAPAQTAQATFGL